MSLTSHGTDGTGTLGLWVFSLFLLLWIILYIFFFFKETWLIGPHHSISKEGYTDRPNAEWPKTKLFLIYGHIVLMKQFRKHTHWYLAVTLALSYQEPGRQGSSGLNEHLLHRSPEEGESPSPKAPDSRRFHLLQEPVQAGTWPGKAIPREELLSEIICTPIMLTWLLPVH